MTAHGAGSRAGAIKCNLLRAALVATMSAVSAIAAAQTTGPAAPEQPRTLRGMTQALL